MNGNGKDADHISSNERSDDNSFIHGSPQKLQTYLLRDCISDSPKYYCVVSEKDNSYAEKISHPSETCQRKYLESRTLEHAGFISEADETNADKFRAVKTLTHQTIESQLASQLHPDIASFPSATSKTASTVETSYILSYQSKVSTQSQANRITVMLAYFHSHLVTQKIALEDALAARPPEVISFLSSGEYLRSNLAQTHTKVRSHSNH